MKDYDQAAEVLKALGHPLRLQILETLHRDGQCCVCHLEAHLGQRQAYISQQLARLREARLVVDRREGMNIYYSLAVDSIDKILALTHDVAQQLNAASSEARSQEPPVIAEPVLCPCPKCAERRASSLSSISPHQEAV